MTKYTELQNLLNHLDDSRLQAAYLKQTIDDRLTEFKSQYQEIYDDLASEISKQSELTDKIRELAIELYGICGDKNFNPNVSIRIRKKYQYETDAALNWGIEHKMCVQTVLDTRAFEDLCKSDKTRPEFVMILEIPTVAIATQIESTDVTEEAV